MKIFLNPIVAFFVFNTFIFLSHSKPDVVLVGENHTDENDHKIQLDIIREYYRYYNGKIVIAMEMFQQPFQKYLDMYIEGQIDEEELTEKSEYKKRWGYDFSYYREILRFARENKIKVFAINIPTELVKQIREKGIDNISSEYIPEKRIDYNKEEIDFLTLSLKEHKSSNYKRFLDIQYSWDIGMSYKIYKLNREYKDYIIVVLAGKGHTKTIKRFIEVLSKESINVKIMN